MLGKLLIIIVGILSFTSAGILTYTYLKSVAEPVKITQTKEGVPVTKKEAQKVATTTPIQKKQIAKTQVTVPVKTKVATTTEKSVSEKTIVAPGPLRAMVSDLSPSTSALSVKGIIYHTNIARQQNGNLPGLFENSLLNKDAQMKVDDMFAKQYFEHVSPIGVGPADLARAVGYEYVVVGENLALGDFSDDNAVVTAWMNSPGHRANILKPQYQEIGVAVGKGMYEGRMTWLAVQSFGMPLSSCPTTDTALKSKIDSNSIAINNLKSQLDAKKAQIDATSPFDPNYNVYVNEFNAIVPNYNNLVEANRIDVASYNAGVQAFNVCIATATAH